MRLLSYGSAAGLTALVVYLLIVGGSILLPFVVAVFVWYLINALATVSRRLRFRGSVMPVSLRLGMATVVLAMLSWLMFTLIVTNVGQVIAKAPVYEQNLRATAHTVAGHLGVEHELPPLEELYAGRLTVLLRSLARSLTSLMGSIGTVAIYVVFMLLEQHSFRRKVSALCHDPLRETRVQHVLDRIGGNIQSYVWLKTIMSLIAAGASYVVMKLVGVDLAEFWAVLIFGLNFIPYIGSWLGVMFPSALALVQFDSLQPFLWTVGLLSIVQFTTGSIVEPKLMGKGLNLSPVVMLLSLSIWGSIWGPVGMLLAVPMMVVLMIVFSQFHATRHIAILMSADGNVASDGSHTPGPTAQPAQSTGSS